ncbi:MAG: nitroreductase family protein [Candidatus Krumholzibacteria bacterium]|nr:nitroreductase family protein [Candidatus Krumholzibacteria bacterium]
MHDSEHRPYNGLPDLTEAEMLARAKTFHELVTRRRTVRDFSDRPVPREIIAACVQAAGQAPSGANMQPWHFEVVGDPVIKKQIRLAAEEEEQQFYEGRASEEWLDVLAPLGTDAEKPFLETAPWLIVIFEQRYGLDPDGEKIRYYYTKESVGLASGFLIAALHNAGLASLTHTPSPMGFLNRILERPGSEKPFLLLVTGYPAEGAVVPDITRKEPGEFIHYRDAGET